MSSMFSHQLLYKGRLEEQQLVSRLPPVGRGNGREYTRPGAEEVNMECTINGMQVVFFISGYIDNMYYNCGTK